MSYVVIFGLRMVLNVYFVFNDSATTEIYTYRHTLSLRDALPICVSAGKVAIHAVGSGLRFKIADVDRGFAVGDEAAAPPRPGMAELCPVIDASGGAPFQRHIVDVGDGDSATRLIYVADIHARSAIGRLCCPCRFRGQQRSEEHTSELQSLMRISYAVFCLKKKK